MDSDQTPTAGDGDLDPAAPPTLKRRPRKWTQTQIGAGAFPAESESPADEDEAGDGDDEPASPKAKSKTPVLVVIVGIVLGLLCWGVVSGKFASKPKPDGSGATAVCRTFVKRQLKAPSTAEFSGETVRTDGPGWLVSGFVDAQNSFGAALRRHYSCSVIPADTTGDNWTLVSLDGLDE
jgi:hypothetical protein